MRRPASSTDELVSLPQHVTSSCCRSPTRFRLHEHDRRADRLSRRIAGPVPRRDDANHALMGCDVRRQPTPAPARSRSSAPASSRCSRIDSAPRVQARRSGEVKLHRRPTASSCAWAADLDARRRRRRGRVTLTPCARSDEHQHRPAAARQCRQHHRQGRRHCQQRVDDIGGPRMARTCWSPSCPRTATTSRPFLIPERVVANRRLYIVRVEDSPSLPRRQARRGGSRATSPTWAEQLQRLDASRSSTSAPRSRPPTSWWARSRRRATSDSEEGCWR